MFPHTIFPIMPNKHPKRFPVAAFFVCQMIHTGTTSNTSSLMILFPKQSSLEYQKQKSSKIDVQCAYKTINGLGEFLETKKKKNLLNGRSKLSQDADRFAHDS